MTTLLYSICLLGTIISTVELGPKKLRFTLKKDLLFIHHETYCHPIQSNQWCNKR